MGEVDGPTNLIPAKDYEKYKLPYVRTEYGVRYGGTIIVVFHSLADAEATASRDGGTVVWRSLSDWLDIKEKN